MSNAASDPVWYILAKGRKKDGPYSVVQLGKVQPARGMRICREGDSEWIALENARERYPELASLRCPLLDDPPQPTVPDQPCTRCHHSIFLKQTDRRFWCSWCDDWALAPEFVTHPRPGRDDDQEQALARASAIEAQWEAGKPSTPACPPPLPVPVYVTVPTPPPVVCLGRRALLVRINCVRTVRAREVAYNTLEVLEGQRQCVVEFDCPSAGSKFASFLCPVCRKSLEIRVGSKHSDVWASFRVQLMLPILLFLLCGGLPVFLMDQPPVALRILGYSVTALAIAWFIYLCAMVWFQWEVGFNPSNVLVERTLSDTRHEVVGGEYCYRSETG